jgi:TRAP-type C4-dicarboxylate transport system substrate-binding protein
MFMKLLNLFKKSEKTQAAEKIGKFSEFFLRASDEEQKQIFAEAARKANEEQREMLAESQLKTKGC